MNQNAAKIDERDLAGATALGFASMINKVNVVKFLLEKGADEKNH